MSIGIQNEELLINAFGKIPGFHDAEIVELSLKREYYGKKCPTMDVLIKYRTFTSKQNGPEKELVKNCHDISLRFTGIFGLKLENFNHQNVLGSLYISDFSKSHLDRLDGDVRLLGLVSNEQIDDLKFFVKFEYCFGIEAGFMCEEIIVDSVARKDAS